MYVKFYNANSATYTDETTDAQTFTIDDVLLPPQQVTTTGDTLYIGSDNQFRQVKITVSTAGSYTDVTFSLEYWNGSSWTSLTGSDYTNGFTQTGAIIFKIPSDWATTDVDGTTAYWIRIVANLGTSPSLTTAPLGSFIGIADEDWAIDFNPNVRRIYYKGAGQRYTGQEFYSWLMDVYDDQANVDDPVPIRASTPTDYTLINSWFMDYESFKYLYYGSVGTEKWDASSYDGGIALITFSATGYTDAVSSDIGLRVSGSTTGEFGNLLAYDNTNRRWWVKVDSTTLYNSLVSNVGETISVVSGTGSGTSSSVDTGEYLWSNIYTLGRIDADSLVHIFYGTYDFTSGYYPSGDEVEPWWHDLIGVTNTNESLDILVLIKEAGTTLGGGWITVFLRNYKDLQSYFEADISSGGRNPISLNTEPDLSNTTAASTVRDYNNCSSKREIKCYRCIWHFPDMGNHYRRDFRCNCRCIIL